MKQRFERKRSTTAVLLIAHGTRSRAGCDAFLELASRVREHIRHKVEVAFLEFAEPTVDHSVERLVREVDPDLLVVAPLMLFGGRHATRDIPASISAALHRCGRRNVVVHQSCHYGCHAAIVELAWRQLMQALQERPPMPAADTLLIVVGRGSRDENATAEMREFARLLAERAGMTQAQVGFLAMTDPSITELLAGVDGSAVRRVVIQPHLLFQGELLRGLNDHVREISIRRPQLEWIVTRALAEDFSSGGTASELLVVATVDLIERALVD